MIDRSAWVWIALAIAVFVYVDLLFVELRRAYREGKRIVERVSAYGDLPVFALAMGTEGHVERIMNALSALEALVPRAQDALAILRNPLHPPEPRAAAGAPDAGYDDDYDYFGASPNGSSTD